MITVKPHLDSSVPPSEWVVTHAQKIKPNGRILDYACGSGRHTFYLAQQGFNVLSIDRDQEALNLIKLQSQNISQATIQTACFDLEGATWDLDHLGHFDAVIVTNYLYRPYLKNITKLLNPKGFLIYETFAIGNEAYGKPSNPNFLLQPNELLNFAENMKILAFEDLIVQTPKPACVQRLCAVPLQSKYD